MVAITSPFLALVLATLFSTDTQVQAHPWPAHAKLGTHRVRTIGKRQVKLETFSPKSSFMVFGSEGPSVQTSSSSGVSLVGGAPPSSNARLMSSVASLSSDLGITADNVAWKSGYAVNETRFGWVRQSMNGVPFANAVGNIAVVGDKVMSFGSSFVDTKSLKNVPSASPSVTWRSVLPQIEDSLDGKFNGQNVTLEYLIKNDGSVALTHVVQIQNVEKNGWLEAFIDAHSGELLSVTDFVAHASYTVLPITKQNFPEGLETLVDPEDLSSSPQGWHSIGLGNSTTTSGNNVLSFKGQQVSSETSPDLNFNAQYDDTKDPTDPVNLNAARQNAFYVLNVMHDVSYRYGFTEDAFNFQLSNFDKGGKGNDRVLVSVQDASGVNNANFATPADGQSGICRMFIWTKSTPRRDGTMENDIMIHEFTHGITNRMTGGGTGRCLQTTEAGGLGEGWGDAMADWVGQNSADTRDYVIAAYAGNIAKGLRRFPYSVDPKVNPLTYSNLRQLNEIHDIGQVWANMLHNVYAVLVAAHGFSTQKLTNADGQEGNIVFMRLFMDSLALQPCQPTFVTTRDAWIQADQNRYKGANRCLLSKAFASRGLGANAGPSFVNDFTLLAGC